MEKRSLDRTCQQAKLPRTLCQIRNSADPLKRHLRVLYSTSRRCRLVRISSRLKCTKGHGLAATSTSMWKSRALALAKDRNEIIYGRGWPLSRNEISTQPQDSSMKSIPNTRNTLRSWPMLDTKFTSSNSIERKKVSSFFRKLMTPSRAIRILFERTSRHTFLQAYCSSPKILNESARQRLRKNMSS